MTCRMLLLATASIMLAAVAHPAGQVSAAQPARHSSSDTEALHGRAIFAAKGCYECHGYVGQGSILSGPALAGRVLTAAGIKAYVRNPRGVMPPYRTAILSEPELDAVTTFVLGLPSGRAAREIPALRSLVYAVPAAKPVRIDPAIGSDGRALYQRHCAVCHGADRSGGAGPDLRRVGAIRTVNDIRAVIDTPPSGMPKLTPNPLSQDQARAIGQFLLEPLAPSSAR